MTTFASTLGTATSTVTQTLNFANALRNLLNWSANPYQLNSSLNASGRPKSMIANGRPLPVLTGGTSISDFSDMMDD